MKTYVVIFSNGQKAWFQDIYEIEEYLKKHKDLEIIDGFAFSLSVNQ